MELTYDDVKGDERCVSIAPGQTVFVLGANGTGKSALMHKAYFLNENARRILAHRQTWFESNSSSLTAAQRNHTIKTFHHLDRHIDSRWKDHQGAQRADLCLFNLIDTINVLARKMDDAVRSNDSDTIEMLKTTNPPIGIVNELFAVANLSISLELDEGDQFFARKSEGERYSIAKLSDGERNAFLIAAEVLTAESGALIIIDEPERHLHRSIISPLLSALFQRRPDCAFLVSTHEPHLPLDNSASSVLLLRGCTWNGDAVVGWDIDLLENPQAIPRDILQSILGARRTVLFVEGESESLDRQIYQILFPNVSVLPKGSCAEVERAVAGIRSTEEQHWIQAFGLIDADNRTAVQIKELQARYVYPLPCYSVESLYYHSTMVNRIATRQSAVTGDDVEKLKSEAAASVIKNVKPHRDRLCTLMVLQKAKDDLLRYAPDEQAVQNGVLDVTIDLPKYLADEKAGFDAEVRAANSDALISRYKVRSTPVLESIAKVLGFQCREKYEGAVRKLLIECEQARNEARSLLGELARELS